MWNSNRCSPAGRAVSDDIHTGRIHPKLAHTQQIAPRSDYGCLWLNAGRFPNDLAEPRTVLERARNCIYRAWPADAPHSRSVPLNQIGTRHI